MSDSRLVVEGLAPGHDTAWLFIAEKRDRLWQVNRSWELYRPFWSTQPCIPSGVAKSSTGFGWGKGGKVTAAGWQVTLCNPIWHVISRSGVVKFTNCCTLFTLLYFTLNVSYSHHKLFRGLEGHELTGQGQGRHFLKFMFITSPSHAWN